jgi:hypothetical protein
MLVNLKKAPYNPVQQADNRPETPSRRPRSNARRMKRDENGDTTSCLPAPCCTTRAAACASGTRYARRFEPL